MRVHLLSALALLAVEVPCSAQPYAYVAASGSALSVISTSTNKHLAKVALQSSQDNDALAVALTPDGARAYVTRNPTASR